MTSVPAPPPLMAPRVSPAGTFLKKSMSHSLVYTKNSEPSTLSKQRKATTLKNNPKSLKNSVPNCEPSKVTKSKLVRRAHSFDDSNHNPNSPRRATNKKQFLKSHSLSDSKSNVTFSHQNSIYEIERFRDVPSITDSDIWWTAKDYIAIKKEYEAVIYLLEQDLPVNESEHSARGLDKRTERGAWALFEHQRNARNAVLRQQDIQRKLKYVDETAIAQAYMRESSALSQQAVQIAAVDAIVARGFLLSNESSVDEKRSSEFDGDPLSCMATSMGELSSSPQTPISTKKPTLSPFKLPSPQSPNCWQDSISFVGCHKAGRSRAAIRDSIVNSYLAAWQQSPSLEDLSKNSVAAKKSIKSYISDDNSLVMSDNDSDCNDATEMDSMSQIDTVYQLDPREDKTMPVQRDRASRHVRFAKKVNKIKRIKVKDVEKDTERRWYSKSELIAIAHVVNNVIEMIEKETQLAENDLVMVEKYNETRRGLEKSTETGAWKLFERRRDAINSVLVLQSQQRHDNMMNPAALAEGYKAATKEACQEAIKFGKQDAKEAKKYRLKRRSVCDNGSSLKKSEQFPVPSDDQRPNGTERSDERNSSPPKRQNSMDDADMCDLSVRSLLDLNEEPASAASAPEYNVDNINRISRSRRRMSASHPPSRRFVLATAAIFDRTQKVEQKETNSVSKGGKTKGGNVVISWRRNSTRTKTSENDVAASNINLLTAMDASVIEDFDVIDHEFTELPSEGLMSLTASGAVNENDIMTKEVSMERDLSINAHPETINDHAQVNNDLLLGLSGEFSLLQRAESVGLINGPEARSRSVTNYVESTSDSNEKTDSKHVSRDPLPATQKADFRRAEVPINERSDVCSPLRRGDSSNQLFTSNAQEKENQPDAGNSDDAMQSQSSLGSDDLILFKVHPSDVRMIKLQGGDVAYLLKNPEKYCVPPSFLK